MNVEDYNKKNPEENQYGEIVCPYCDLKIDICPNCKRELEDR